MLIQKTTSLKIAISTLLTVFGSIIAVEDSQTKPSSHKQALLAIEKTEKWLINNLNQNHIYFHYYDPLILQYQLSEQKVHQIKAARQLAVLASSNPTLNHIHLKNLQAISRLWFHEEEGYIAFSEGDKSLEGTAEYLRVLLASPNATNTPKKLNKQLTN